MKLVLVTLVEKKENSLTSWNLSNGASNRQTVPD